MTKHRKFMDYTKHCEWAVSKWGPKASAWLTTYEHFEQWLRWNKHVEHAAQVEQGSHKFKKDHQGLDSVKRALSFEMEEADAERRLFAPFCTLLSLRLPRQRLRSWLRWL